MKIFNKGETVNYIKPFIIGEKIINNFWLYKEGSYTEKFALRIVK